jgi:hypothetical protein
MKTFRQLREQIIAEAPKMKDQKGWINYKTGKSYIWKTSTKPWHMQYVCMHPKKFGLTEEKILQILAEAGWVDPNNGTPNVPDEETQKSFEYLKNGVHDTQFELRDYLEKQGWVQVSHETYTGITGGSMKANERDLHSLAKIIEKKLSASSLDFTSPHVGIMLLGKRGTERINIKDKFTWKSFLNTGKVVKQRSALAAFR